MHCLGVILLITVLSPLLLAAGHEISLWNDRNCPPKYEVFTSEGKKIDVQITKPTNLGCNYLIGNQKKRKKITDLKPTIKTAFKNGQYVANITWVFKTNHRRQLPGQFLLNLTFYEEINDGMERKYRYSNNTCVSLNINETDPEIETKTRKRIRVKFYFDCLPLQRSELAFLQAEVLIFPQQPDYDRQCRSIRSLPDGSRKCGSPGIYCSPPYNFGVAINANKYRQCACYWLHYGDPNITWYRDIKAKQFRITVTNLPPYLEEPAQLQVFSTDRNELDLFKEMITESDTQSVTYTAQLTDDTNFEVYVRVNATLETKCAQPGALEREYQTEINQECKTEDGSMFLAYHKTFKNAPISSKGGEEVGSNIDYTIVLAVVLAVVLTATITSVVFVCKCRKSRGSRSSSAQPKGLGSNIEMRPLSETPRLTDRGIVETVIEEKSSDIEKLSTETSYQDVKEQYVEYDSKEVDQLLETQPPDCDTQPWSMMTQLLTFDSRMGRVPVVCAQCEKNSMLTNKVHELTSILKQNKSLGFDIIEIKCDSDNDSEKYVDSCSDHVIIVMSEELNEICRRTTEVFRSEHENVIHSCNLLKTLNLYAPNTSKTSIHLLSFCSVGKSSGITLKFLHGHGLDNETNCYLYYFVGDSVDSPDNAHVLELLSQRLCVTRASKVHDQTKGDSASLEFENNDNESTSHDTNRTLHRMTSRDREDVLDVSSIQRAMMDINME